MSDGIDGLDRLAKRIAELAFDTRRVERPLHAIGVYMLGSVERNFQAQGRPTRWTPLKPSTLARRRKGPHQGGPQILMDTGGLKHSIKEQVTLSGNSSVSIGSNKKYARRQQMGYEGKTGKGAGRGHSPTPARPFLLIQEEDKPKIIEIARRCLEGKL